MNKQSSVAIVGAVFMALETGLPAAAATFSGVPLFDVVNNYNTTITANGDMADVYFPVQSDANNSTEKLPITLLLPGALVDKSYYSNFATTVASYGFAVVVLNQIITAATVRISIVNSSFHHSK